MGQKLWTIRFRDAMSSILLHPVKGPFFFFTFVILINQIHRAP